MGTLCEIHVNLKLVHEMAISNFWHKNIKKIADSEVELKDDFKIFLVPASFFDEWDSDSDPWAQKQ